MPPLWESDLLYMPTTLPGISITAARELLQQTDRTIEAFPEVAHVFGKVGRAETATDPPPLSMVETTILLEPREAWRPGMTPSRLVSELHEAIEIPGLTDAWTMPETGGLRQGLPAFTASRPAAPRSAQPATAGASADALDGRMVRSSRSPPRAAFFDSACFALRPRASVQY